MHPTHDDDQLIAALRRLPRPEPPRVEPLLARAAAERQLRRGSGPRSAAAASLLVASLAALAPAADRSRAWIPGLLQRCHEFSLSLISPHGRAAPPPIHER